MVISKDEAMTEAKIVRFTKKDMAIIQKSARRKGLKIASFIRMAVLDYLERENP